MSLDDLSDSDLLDAFTARFIEHWENDKEADAFANALAFFECILAYLNPEDRPEFIAHMDGIIKRVGNEFYEDVDDYIEHRGESDER